MTNRFNPRELARTVGATLAAFVLGTTFVLAAAGPAEAQLHTVHSIAASAIVGGK